MTHQFLAIDIETVKTFPSGEDWKLHRPLGISCAVTVTDNQDPIVWTTRQPDGSYADRMSQEDAARLVEYLSAQTVAGRTVVTWNGIGFDWQVIAEESHMTDVCRDLALDHVDMMYHFHAVKGFPLGLNAAAQGVGTGSKTAGMSGVDAPQLWADGNREAVVTYCKQDATLTLQVAQSTQRNLRLDWTSRSGRPNNLLIPEGWLTVRQAADLPIPDTSWMDDPIPRSAFNAWLYDDLDETQ